MPARRIPTEALEARGGYKGHADRKRARANEPKGLRKLGAAPAYFDDKQRGAWAEVVRRVPWLKDSDFLTVERLAVLMAEFREDPKGFSSSKHATIGALEGKLGMTSADRTRVSEPEKPKLSRLAKALSLQ